MPRQSSPAAGEVEDRVRRYKELAILVRKWMDEDDGYTDEQWAVVERELQDCPPMGCREPDGSSA